MLYMVMELVQGGEFFTYLQVGGGRQGCGGGLGCVCGCVLRPTAITQPASRPLPPPRNRRRPVLSPALQAREAPLSEDEARFYAGCCVLGLEYMHDRGIAWR